MILATVSSIDPLEVDLDTYGDVPVSWVSADGPDALVAGLTVGDRVTVAERPTRGRAVEYVLTGRLAGGGPPPVDMPDILRFAQYNILYAGYPAGGNPERAWSARKPYFADAVLAAGVSVVSLQELDYPGLVNDQAVELQVALNARPGSSGQWVVKSFLSRCGIAYDGAVWSWSGIGGRGTSAWAEREPVWLMLTHRVTGVRTIVVADHWHYADPAIRRQNAEDSRRLCIDLHQRYGMTVTLGCDTNDYGSGWGGDINAFCVGDHFARLEAAFPAATGQNLPSWNDFRSGPPWSSDGQQYNEWIDQVFVPAGTPILAGGMWEHTTPFATPLPSDHQMMWADIVLSDARLTPVADTGWRPHGSTLAAGYTATGLEYRIVDGVCHWRGLISKSGGITTGNLLTGMPDEARPASGSGGYALPVAYHPELATITVGAYPDDDGSLYAWAHTWSGDGVQSIRISGSYSTT